MITRDKYAAIAFSSPKGVRLMGNVRLFWKDFVEEINNLVCRDFSGWETKLHGDRVFVEELSQRIFVEAVWGFGVEDWCSRNWLAAARKYRGAQVVQFPGVPSYLVDKDYFDSHGIVMPPEFVILDQWLEKLPV